MQIFNNYRELLHKFYTLVAHSLSRKSWKFCCIYRFHKIMLLLIMTPGSFDVIKHCLNSRQDCPNMSFKHVHISIVHIWGQGLFHPWRLRLLNRLTCHPHVTKTWHYAARTKSVSAEHTQHTRAPDSFFRLSRRVLYMCMATFSYRPYR